MEEKEMMLKLYSPLLATIYSNKEFSEDEEDPCADFVLGDDIVYYEEIIRAAVEQYNERSGGDLMAFLDEARNPGLKAKVIRAIPSVESRSGELMGCTMLELKEPLHVSEMEELANFLYQQFSDGWGKEFEQQEILCEDIVLRVHFGKADPFYLETEFDVDVEQYPLKKSHSLKEYRDDAR